MRVDSLHICGIDRSVSIHIPDERAGPILNGELHIEALLGEAGAADLNGSGISTGRKPGLGLHGEGSVSAGRNIRDVVLAQLETAGMGAIQRDGQRAGSRRAVVGDGNGLVGFGIGKSGEVPDAIRKGIEDAKKNVIKVALKGTTIPHEIKGKFGAGEVLLMPAPKGTGVIAGGPVRAVVETVGIKDIRTKAIRSNNPCNVVRATINGLSQLRTADEVAAIRGKATKEILG